MSLLPTIGAIDQDTGFYNGVVETSVRLAGDSYLTLDNVGSATSTQKCTLSCWFKRTELTVLSNIFHSANDSGGASFGISLDAADTISVTQYSGANPFDATAYDFGVTVAPRKFKDTSAWYHLVVTIDTTLGSGTTNEADRIKIYINGTRQTVVATSDGSGSQDFADEDQTVASFQDGKQTWGATVTGSQIAHIYLAECNGVDGLALDASYFGETKNGVWIPIAPNVSEYGNHGFRLQFTSTAHDAPASLGSADTDNIGADSSGKNNHFTAVDAIGTHDCAMPDSPENNFCTLNGVAKSSGLTLSEGNLQTNNSADFALGTIGVNSGKWYYENYINSTNGGFAGVYESDSGVYSTTIDDAGNNPDGYGIYSNGQKVRDGSYVNYGSAFTTAGDIIGVALDMDNGAIYFSKNGTWQNSATTSEIAAGTTTNAAYTGLSGNMVARVGHYNNNNPTIVNFGQDASFAGSLTGSNIGDETPSEGAGVFKYAPPSGFLTLCSANISDDNIPISPAQTTQADDYFNTALWSGNSSTQDVVVGFQPDWVWLKVRNHTYFHELYDSSRGATKKLRSNNDSEEATQADGVTDFTASGGGFSLGAGAGGNESGKNYVAWNWKANGGTTSSNTDGDVTSTVQANTDAGFSIVTWTQGSGQTDVGHGLGAVPDMIIGKTRTPSSGSWGWHTFHKDLGVSKYLFLNATTSATTSSNIFNPVNSTVFGSSEFLFQASTPNVAYCFKSVEGYSRFGSYTGNGLADGTFVYTGFRPAWVMTKSIGSGNWYINDSARSTANPTSSFGANLYADLSNDESGNGMDILSNGFKIRNTDGSQNASGGTYIYMAFAEAPFKYANAR